MLYQGIITLLSTLLGGLLAITGSSIANHYNHKKTLLLERRKEKLERIKEKRNIRNCLGQQGLAKRRQTR